ncbi:MAG: SufD family Fe-S cluster assembly protein [Rikenellaceae bacterium]
MERFLKYLETQDLRRVSDGVLTLDDSTSGLLQVAIDPTTLSVESSAMSRATQLIIVRGAESGSVKINIAAGSSLNLLEVLFDGAESDVEITQGDSSKLHSTILQIAKSSVRCIVNLDGRGAESEVNILQLATGEDKVVMDLRLSHNVSDCSSRSLSKCVASGSSTGEFHGLVYVAQDAQRTLAEQSSRNVQLSPMARIVAEPQLEIYADDVKCSHGATVGQMNQEAIYYMMQRGLSEEQARKLQLDGFVSEVTQRCSIEGLCEGLSQMVRERLGEL